MQTLAFLSIIGLIWTLWVGLGCLVHKYVDSYPLARLGGPIFLILLLWGIEHGIGFGPNLFPIALLMFAGSCWAISKAHQRVCLSSDFWSIELGTAGGLFLAFIYRYYMPSIDGASERLADLSHTLNFLAGSTLPPNDSWMPGYPANAYYHLQYYASGLVGRLGQLTAGQTYNASIILCTGWIGGAFAHIGWTLSRKHIPATIATWLLPLLGGSFTSALIWFTHKQWVVSDPVRYIDSSLKLSNPNLTPFGHWLADFCSRTVPTDQSAEMLSYVIYLGDWHPPFIGYALLGTMLAILAPLLIHPTRQNCLPWFVAGMCLPASLAGNPWITPLMGILLIGILIWFSQFQLPTPLTPLDPKKWRSLLLPWISSGFGCIVATLLTSLPLHGTGEGRTMAAPTTLRFIPWDPTVQFTPPLLWLAVFGGGILLAWCSKDSFKGNWKLPLLCAIPLLAFGELFYIDDVYSGDAQRFNTTLKWWPFIIAALGLMFAPTALTHPNKRIKLTAWLAVGILIIPSAYEYARATKGTNAQRARWEGDGYYLAIPEAKAILQILRGLPQGVVLEYQPPNSHAFTPIIYGVHSGKYTWIGWSWHQELWRGPQPEVLRRRQETAKFYLGQIENPSEWAQDNGIDYIVWSSSLHPKANLTKELRVSLNEKLKHEFVWHQGADENSGVWVSKAKNRSLIKE